MNIPDAMAWLRQQIEGDKAAALAASWQERDGDRWHVWGERSDRAWVIDDQGEEGFIVGEAPAADTEAIARHVAAHDPQDVIARCEAELAILDECQLLRLVGIAYPGEAGPESAEKISRLIASGYRHRPGWAEHWGSE